MNTNTREWNPRYLAYCAATGGLSPEETMQRDRAGRPGGSMAGFLVWHGRKLGEWRQATGHRGPLDHAAYDAWLWASVVSVGASGQTQLARDAA